jgi:hypothetical protein
MTRLAIIPCLPPGDILRANLDTLMFRLLREIDALLERKEESTRRADDAACLVLVTVGDMLLEIARREAKLTDAQMRGLYRRLHRRPVTRRPALRAGDR